MSHYLGCGDRSSSARSEASTFAEFCVFNNLFVHVIGCKILLATCIFRTAKEKNFQDLCGDTQYHISIILIANGT